MKVKNKQKQCQSHEKLNHKKAGITNCEITKWGDPLYNNFEPVYNLTKGQVISECP